MTSENTYLIEKFTFATMQWYKKWKVKYENERENVIVKKERKKGTKKKNVKIKEAISN